MDQKTFYHFNIEHKDARVTFWRQTGVTKYCNRNIDEINSIKIQVIRCQIADSQPEGVEYQCETGTLIGRQWLDGIKEPAQFYPCTKDGNLL